MLKGQMLRALVSERLAAAAEDIFVLFERTIAEYEEELSRSKEENHRKQQILDQLLTPRIQLVRKDLQVTLTSPDPGPETSQMNKEQSSVKQEEEQLPVCVPESSAVSVKTEESSLLQQRQSEHREETQGENRRSEPHVHSETVTGHTEHLSDTDNDDDWEPSSSSSAQMETEANNNQVQSRDRSTEVSSLNTSAPQNTDYNHMSEYDRKKYQCPVCARRFKTKQILNIHLRLHTGEGFSCSFCEKIFPQKSHLVAHIRTHTGEKPFSCFFCNKGFAQKSNLVKHSKTHTVENTYKFTSICGKSFPDISGLDIRLVQD